jgi:hypothetical protein
MIAPIASRADVVEIVADVFAAAVVVMDAAPRV